MIDRNNEWIQKHTQIYTHTPSRQCSPAPTSSYLFWSANVNPHHLKSPHVPQYFFHGPELLLLTIPLPDKSSDGEQKQANKTKEFKNKQQEGHFTQINTSNWAASAKETHKHTANMPRLNTARSLTQEVRQSLEKLGAEHRKSFSTAGISKSGVMERAQE